MRRRMWMMLSLALLVFAGWLAFLHFEPRLFPMGELEPRFMVDVPAFSGYVSTSGATLTGAWIAAGEFDDAGMARARRADRYGWIDRRGRIVIAFEWESAGDFSRRDFAAVERDDVWRLIDRRGAQVNSNEWDEKGGNKRRDEGGFGFDPFVELKNRAMNLQKRKYVVDAFARGARTTPGKFNGRILPMRESDLPGGFRLIEDLLGHPLTYAMSDRFPTLASWLAEWPPFAGHAKLLSPSGAVIWRSDLHYFRFLLLPAAAVSFLLATFAYWRYRMHRRRVN